MFQIERRKFVALLGAAVTAWPLGVCAHSSRPGKCGA
jgi:hypothetical protein